MLRLRVRQTWPELPNAPIGKWAMTTSRSASSQIIAADFPPSSRLERVKFRAQLVAIARPAAVEPVQVTITTSGWPTRRAPASPPPGDRKRVVEGQRGSVRLELGGGRD